MFAKDNFITMGPVPDKYEYRILGIVGTSVNNKGAKLVSNGCGGSKTTRVYYSKKETFQAGAHALIDMAKEMGGNAVVHARFDYRIAVETLQSSSFFNNDEVTNQVFELVCSGTVIKITGVNKTS